MRVRSLIPWRVSALRSGDDAFSALQNEMNRLFEGFVAPDAVPAAFAAYGPQTPKLDVSETDSAIDVHLEVPGLEDKDLDIELTQDALRIRGEKKDVRTEEGRDFHRTERWFGKFERVIPLPSPVDREKVAASVTNGVLNVSMPKAVKENPVQKITVGPAPRT